MSMSESGDLDRAAGICLGLVTNALNFRRVGETDENTAIAQGYLDELAGDDQLMADVVAHLTGNIVGLLERLIRDPDKRDEFWRLHATIRWAK